jgi:hypothetical protein
MARRRRRASSRQSSRIIVAVVLVLVLFGLLLSGIVSAASSSSSYVALVNGSFAAQSNTVSEAQRVQGSQLSELLSSMPGLDRQSLAARLTELVRQTARSAELQARATDPGPSNDVGPKLAAVVADRAAGTAGIAAAVEALLGLELPKTGGSASSAPTTLTSISPATAITRLTDAGVRIAFADARVAGLRASLAAAPGHAHLVRNPFVVDDSILGPGAMARLVGSLQSSASLAIVHDLQLGAVSISPSPLPATTVAGLTELPPTSSIAVSAVIRNLGNVAERGVVVTASLSSIGGAILSSSRVSGTVSAVGALSLDLPPLKVSPGSGVQLTVTLVPSSSQVDQSALTQQFGLSVAPNSPPVSTQG